MTSPLARRRSALLLALSLGLAPAGCVRDNPAFMPEGDAETETETETDSEGADAAAAGATVAAVTYDLTWSWGQATALAGGGWTTVNDLGYRIEVTRGHLVSYSASLSPCTPASAGEAAPASLPERLLSALAAPGIAWAGHSGVADPSQVELPQVEDLAAPVDRRLGEASFDAARYCWIHYLAARAGEATLGLPEDLDLVGVTLYLEGTYALTEGNAEAFTASIDAASGALVDLQGALAGAGTGARARVVVTRDLGRAFDGADPAALDAEALGRIVLENLVAGAAVSITLE